MSARLRAARRVQRRALSAREVRNTVTMSSLAGKGILVTEAASGIGAATVEKLLADGASVIGVDLASEAP